MFAHAAASATPASSSAPGEGVCTNHCATTTAVTAATTASVV